MNFDDSIPLGLEKLHLNLILKQSKNISNISIKKMLGQLEYRLYFWVKKTYFKKLLIKRISSYKIYKLWQANWIFILFYSQKQQWQFWRTIHGNWTIWWCRFLKWNLFRFLGILYMINLIGITRIILFTFHFYIFMNKMTLKQFWSLRFLFT